MKRSVHLRAFTLIELLVIAASLLVLCLVLIPSVHRVKRTRDKTCRNNLRQVLLAFKTWNLDSGDGFPAVIPVRNGGAKESAEAGQVSFNFLVMSNELGTAKVLVCPTDNQRTAAKSFGPAFGDTNVSYFVGLDANDTLPQALLSGDRNLAFGGRCLPHGLFPLSTNMILTWTKDLHRFCGNIGLADGSVQFSEQANLVTVIQEQGLATNRLAIP